jgi:hypothetical protein
MKAMVLNNLCSLKETQHPLVLTDLPDPVPGCCVGPSSRGKDC